MYTQTLTFTGHCPYQVGDEVRSPVGDSTGMVWHFSGSAHVIELGMSQSRCDESVFTLKVEHHPPVFAPEI